MSCDTDHPATDPASLRPRLLRRIPSVSGSADEFLREAATEFFRKSGVWRTQRLTLICDMQRVRYELPVPSAGRIVRLAHVWGMSQFGEYKLWPDKEVRMSLDGRQRWHQPTPSTIAFHKPMEDSCSLRLEAVLTIGDDNVGDAELIEEYREGIIAGACHYATMAQDKETSNRNAGIDYFELFNSAIRDASAVYQQKAGVERAPMSRMKAMRGSQS